MVNKHSELNKLMNRQEMIAELSKVKDKLLCRKKSLLLEMGYQETPFVDLIVADSSECAIKGTFNVVFHKNTNTVKNSTLSFVMENEEQGDRFEKAVEKIADDVVEACKEVFGLHNIDDRFPSFDSLSDEENEIKQPNDSLEYKFAGVAENGKRMYVVVLCDKVLKKQIVVGIYIFNYKWEDKKDGK